MNVKKKLFWGRCLLCTGALFAMTTVLSSCNDDSTCPNPPIIDPSVPEVISVVPDSLSQCLEADVAALKLIAEANPSANLFNGDQPSEWKGIKVQWTKLDDGKFAVKGLIMDDDNEISGPISIHFGDADHKETADVRFEHLSKIMIKSAMVSDFYVAHQPALDSVSFDGKGVASVRKFGLVKDSLLSFVDLKACPQLDELWIRGAYVDGQAMDDDGDMVAVITKQYIIDKIMIQDLPKLESLNRIAPLYGEYLLTDANGGRTSTNAMAVKELVIGKGMAKMWQIKFDYLSVGKLSMADKATYPEMMVFDMSGQGLTGDLTIANMPKLSMLNLQNNELTSLTVSDCPTLEALNCFGNISLNSLTLSNLDKIKRVVCYETMLSQLDFSKLTSLTKIDAHKTGLESIILPDATGDANKLEMLVLSDNNLTSLDTSAPKVKNIFSLILDHNKLTALDLSNMGENLERLQVKGNMLSSLTLPAESSDAFDEFELQDNHLSIDQLMALKDKGRYSTFKYAPQYVDTGLDVEKKQINASMYADKGTLMVQKADGDNWKTVATSDYTVADHVYTFFKAGKYRVILTDVGTLYDFDETNPYSLGEIEIK